MTSVLITGAQGFLGRYLCAALREGSPHEKVVGIGRSAELPGHFTHSHSPPSLRRAPLPSCVGRLLSSGYSYERADVHDTARVAALLERHRPHLVFHLAGALRPAMTAHGTAARCSGAASLMSAIAAEPGTVRRLVIGSSGAVYGAPATCSLPLHESHACLPVDPYGACKLDEEAVAIDAGRRLSVQVVVARLFNLVGPGQDEVHACGRFARLIAAEAPVLHVRSLHATRDFIDVRDAARALILLALRGETGSRYNVGRGIEVSLDSVLRQMLAIGGYRGRVVMDLPDGNLPNVARHCADIGRIASLGFAPKYELIDTLKDMLGYHAGFPEPLASTFTAPD